MMKLTVTSFLFFHMVSATDRNYLRKTQGELYLAKFTWINDDKDAEPTTKSDSGGINTNDSGTVLPEWCTSDLDCSDDSLVCEDKSNGSCFSPPCGRCIDALENANTSALSTMSMPMTMQDPIREETFDFLN